MDNGQLTIDNEQLTVAMQVCKTTRFQLLLFTYLIYSLQLFNLQFTIDNRKLIVDSAANCQLSTVHYLSVPNDFCRYISVSFTSI